MKKKESFLKYITQKDGFGKTSWPEFIAIQAFVLVFSIMGIRAIEEFGGVPLGIALLMDGILVYKTWQEWKGLD
jgi:hypothetical protein